MQLFRRHALPSIRSKLVTLVLACALPILAGYFAFARDAAERERVHIEQDAQTVAQALVAAVDRDLSNGETAARVLANSAALAGADLAQFHASARRLLRPEFPAYAFVLSGPDGAPLVNTRFAYGAPLPALDNVAQIRRVFASGDAVTSGLHRSEAGQPLVISIDVPVWRDGKVAYALSVQLRPRRMAELLESQRLPPNWVAEVFDNQRLVVARSVELTRYMGTQMAPALAERVAQAASGVVELPEADTGQEFSAFSRSPEHGWTVAVGFPRGAARDLLGHSQGTILSGVALLLAISLGFAWAIGGSIARAVRALTAPAAALGRGEALAMPALPIREAAAVAQALQRVDAELLRYRTQLESLVAERTAELERSNAQLESVYASAPVGLCFLDRELRVVMINDYLAAINAAPALAYLGRTLPELMGAAGADFERVCRRVLDTGRPLVGVESSGEMPASPGITRHWIASYYPVFGPRRELEGINAVVLDISERKLEEQRNRDHEELYRALYEGAADAHMLIAYGAGYISGNQAAAQLFGCASVAEFLTLSPASASPEFQPDGRRSDSLAQEYTRIALERGGHQFEWLHRRRDGSTFHADIVLTSVDIGGKGIIQSSVRDISARVASEAALRAASARLEQRGRFIRTVTDHLPALVAYWDAGLRCQFANQPFLEWLGRGADDVIGQPVAALMPPEQFAQVAPYVHRVLEGQRQSFARELHRPSGELFHAWVNFIPDFDKDGSVRGFYMLHADVTELKRAQSQLVQALREAEHASSAKGEFLANMSHEIRTPMNAIMGLARLLEEAPLGGRERGYVARMKLAAKSLLAMLSDVLDYSRVDAGQLALEHTPFRLDEVLDSVAVLAASNAWCKGVEPVFAVAPGVPARLVGDPLRLEQVLLNLVGNAIKFTEQGEVVLSIGATSGDAGTVVLAFAVRDSGIGIAPERHERMFEAFSQGDSSTSRQYGGAGLGLAISRRLVEMMGGQLRVNSNLGHGAEFHFEAAFALAGDGPGPALPGPPGPLTVLVADDNASACAALADACAGFGWEVDRAHSGSEALALLRGARRYDLAFLDSEMPDLDGVTVIARACADQSIRLPRCALMAADPERERLAALEGGVHIDAFLAKPVTPGALLHAIAELRGGASGTAAPARSPVPLAARLDGLRVLLAEDNLLNQEVASYVLVHAGAVVDTAANGQAAVNMLAQGPAQYDAVLMDLQMPVMDGFEAAAAIRAMGLSLPILAMTANVMVDDRRRALAAGMDAHLAKPIDVDELVETLARVTGRTAPGPGPASGAPDPAPPASLAGIDLVAALPRFGGSFERYAPVLQRFEHSERATLDAVRALLRAADRAGARQLLHRLRGVAANLGAAVAAALALELEQVLAGAESGDDVLAPLLADLDAALQVVFRAARALAPPGAAQVPQAGLPAPRDALVQLLDSLQNNNLGALAQFEVLRPALAPDAASKLSAAVGSLRFDAAAALVHAILYRKEET